MKHAISLLNAQQAHSAFEAAWKLAKPWLLAGHRLELAIRPEKRSDRENRLLHSMLSHIAAHQEWAGKKHDAETWKRLLIAAWCRANGEVIEYLPALDGHGIDIVFRRSSELTRGECADLITFIYAWGCENDVRFPPDPRDVPQLAAA